MALSVKNMLGGSGMKAPSNGEEKNVLFKETVNGGDFVNVAENFISDSYESNVYAQNYVETVSSAIEMLNDNVGVIFWGASTATSPNVLIAFRINDDLSITYGIPLRPTKQYVYIRPRLFTVSNNTMLFFNNGASNSPCDIDVITIDDDLNITYTNTGVYIYAYNHGIYDMVNISENKYVIIGENSSRYLSGWVLTFNPSTNGVSVGALTVLRSGTSTGEYIPDARGHIAFSDIENRFFTMYGNSASNRLMLCTVSGTTITTEYNGINFTFEISSPPSTRNVQRLVYRNGYAHMLLLTGSVSSVSPLVIFKAVYDETAISFEVIEQRTMEGTATHVRYYDMQTPEGASGVIAIGYPDDALIITDTLKGATSCTLKTNVQNCASSKLYLVNLCTTSDSVPFVCIHRLGFEPIASNYFSDDIHIGISKTKTLENKYGVVFLPKVM